MQDIISSIDYDQQEILNNIIHLYIPSGRFDLDPCYSKGVFYKDGIVPQPVRIMDIEPINDTVLYGDCRHTLLPNASIDSIIFDPPFLATKGPSLSKDNNNNNKINRRFGVYPDEQSLLAMYQDSISEFYRVLRHNGILVFKCQDKISSGKQYIMHNKIINECEKIGFVCEDIFILLAKNRIVADWQAKNQKHARKFHSYFLVFKKKEI